MIGEKIRYSDLPEDGMIETFVNKKQKMIPWWELYKFKNYEQYEQWRGWVLEELKSHGREKEIDQIDMTYGMNFRFEEIKKGQLSLSL